MSRQVTVKLDERGRLTLPEKLRRKYGWEAGTTFFLVEEGGRVTFAPAQNPFLAETVTGSTALEGATWEERFDALLDRVRQQPPIDVSPEQLAAEIEEEVQAVRRERRARGD
jgi:bifunctional DNA-binding transcriptional regulator/antitoxin component of YhaV-PrlF toxin-antitoxin module